MSDIYNIIKNFSLVGFDCSQNVSLVYVRAHHNFNFTTVECFCILMVCRLPVNFIRSFDDFIQICCHPHFVCIHLGIFPL